MQTEPITLRLPPEQSHELLDTAGCVALRVQPDPQLGITTVDGEQVLNRGHVLNAPGNGWLAGMLVWRQRGGQYRFVPLPEAISQLGQRLADLDAENIAKSHQPPWSEYHPLSGYLDGIEDAGLQLRHKVGDRGGLPVWDSLPDRLADLLVLDGAAIIENLAGAMSPIESIGRAVGLGRTFTDSIDDIRALLSDGRAMRLSWLARCAISHHVTVARLIVFLVAAEVQGHGLEPDLLEQASRLASHVELFPENRAAFRLIDLIDRAGRREDGISQLELSAIIDGLYGERAVPTVTEMFASLTAKRTQYRDAQARKVAVHAQQCLSRMPADEAYRDLWNAFRRLLVPLTRATEGTRPDEYKALAAQFRALWLRRCHSLHPEIIAEHWCPAAPQELAP